MISQNLFDPRSAIGQFTRGKNVYKGASNSPWAGIATRMLQKQNGVGKQITSMKQLGGQSGTY